MSDMHTAWRGILRAGRAALVRGMGYGKSIQKYEDFVLVNIPYNLRSESDFESSGPFWFSVDTMKSIQLMCAPVLEFVEHGSSFCTAMRLEKWYPVLSK